MKQPKKKQAFAASLKRTGKRVIRIEFPFDYNTIDAVKTIPGRKYHPEVKCWSAPLGIEAIEKLIEYGFSLDAELHGYLNTAKVDINAVEQVDVPGLKGELYPFQRQGISFIEAKKGRVLIGDEMGLGKTVQALAYLQLHPEKRPALVVCPSSLKLNWKREIEKWMNPTGMIEILQGTSPYKLTGNVIIINYDILDNWKRVLINNNFQVMITDECFPANTKISTPYGDINIEDIHIGDQVYNATGIGTVEKINKRITNNIITLHLNNGKMIRVTENHPFFTDQGWVAAKHLNGKYIYDMSDIFNIFAKDINIKANETNNKSMRVVWEDIHSNTSQKEILRNILLSEMEEYSPECQKSIKLRRKEEKNEQLYEASIYPKSRLIQTSFKKNENKQSLIQARSHGKDKRSLGEVWASSIQTTTTRRQWASFSDTTKSAMGSIGSGMEIGISYCNKTIQRFRIPIVLQSRYCSSKTQNLDRNRRMESFYFQRKNKRQEKIGFAAKIRVERIEIQKRTGDEQSSNHTVYNLQVSSHPSYYAEGFLVHNCHFYKNNKAKRTKAVKKIGKGILHVLALSGTPIVNRPVEIYNAVNIIDPTIFPTYWDYAKKYCGLRHNGFGWDFSGATNIEELHEKLTSTCMIRRLKKDVLADLPDKIRSHVPMELDNREEYNAAESDLIQYLSTNIEKEIQKTEEKAIKEFERTMKRQGIKNYDPNHLRLTKAEIDSLISEKTEGVSRAEILTKIETLKQLSVQGKLKASTQWIRDFIDTDGKLVVFASHRFVIDHLMEEFRAKAVKIDGSVSGVNRDKAVQEFQNNKQIRLFVGNIKAAGVGLTLTAAANVAFLEYGWSSSEHSQAEDRCHRISQKSSVNVYYLIAEDTIEEKIVKMIVKKAKIVDQILDGGIVGDTNIFENLIRDFQNK